MKKVILDTDTANESDDYFVLAYFLKNKNLFDVKAITLAPLRTDVYQKNVSDSIDNSYNAACTIFDYLNINDKSIIYKGSRDYICNGYSEESSAVKKIIEIAKTNDKVYILSIGCLTNVALAIKKAPEIINHIEVIWLGTNFLFGPNSDFNFIQDVEAVKIVFKSEVKLTIIPCSPIASNLMVSIYELKAEIGGKNELCDYLCEKFYNRLYGPTKKWPLWDISVIVYMINDEWFSTMEISCLYIKDDNTFILEKGNHKVKFVNYLNANSMLENLFETLKR